MKPEPKDIGNTIHNVALVMGWRVLRVTGTQVKSGAALSWLELALETGS